MNKKKRLLYFAMAMVVLLGGWYVLRNFVLLTTPPAPTTDMISQSERVSIIRDEWGVPHIFGETDADAAFGLAYAHAEDDFPLIQAVLAASTGRLSLLYLSKQAVANDFYYHFIRVDRQLDKQYDQLAPATRKVLDGYAAGFNYYAALHSEEADGRLYPVTGRDLAAGFAHKIPYMFQLPRVLSALLGAENKEIGDPILQTEADGQAAVGQTIQIASRNDIPFSGPMHSGSNTHAVAGWRFNDGITRLNINSHQPWEGPVAWYEAHIKSDEGWNMVGGTFPGAPVILHGHNDFLGWAHTVNYPDLIDVYKLAMHPDGSLNYYMSGEWKRLRKKEAPIEIDLGFFNYTFSMDVYYSPDHGPVLKTDHGYYAVRYANMDRSIFAVEQWYQMNKATNFLEWQSAMQQVGIPMFNTGYADYQSNIFYVYNARLPRRKPGFNYKRILPGAREDLIWNEYYSYNQLPSVLNPPSGFIQNCNTSPFTTTEGFGNPLPGYYQPEDGIETNDNNRSLRSRRLLTAKPVMTWDDFLAMKFDRTYATDAPIFTKVLGKIFKRFQPKTPDERDALKMLKTWDRTAGEDSKIAALALLTYHPFSSHWYKPGDSKPASPGAALRAAIEFLKTNFGRLDVPLGEVQRLRRGKTDLPLGGGFDLLNAVDTRLEDGRMIGFQGDSYINMVSFTPDGPATWSRHQYGNSNRPDSKHYDDQAAHFVKRKLKRIFRDRETLRKTMEKEYHPGKE